MRLRDNRWKTGDYKPLMVRLPDGTLISCHSYNGTDDDTHLEVVKWRI